MRHAPRALLAGGLGFAVSLLVACGGSGGLLSSNQASTLNGTLAQVSSDLQAGNCSAAQQGLAALTNAVQSLPSSIDPTLQKTLQQGASRVQALASSCKSVATRTTKTTPTTTTSSAAPTTSTPTTTTTTTDINPPTTTSTSTTPSSGTDTTSTAPTGGVGPGNSSGGGAPGNGSTPPGNGGAPPGDGGNGNGHGR